MDLLMSLSGDESIELFVRTIWLTLFYAAAAWLPLRASVAVLRSVQAASVNKKDRRRRRHPRAMHPRIYQ